MRRKYLVCLVALLITAAALFFVPPLCLRLGTRDMPGTTKPERELVRLWVVSSPGGGMDWLRACLKRHEKTHPGVMTYLRQVSADDCTAEDAVLPDVLFFMPGDFTAPDTCLTPLSGVLHADEPLLRCGRWRGSQMGLPLCWEGYMLAVDASIMPQSAVTPAPTTLLGRAAPMQETEAPAPSYPVEVLSALSQPLQAAKGAGLFTLATLLPDALRPPLPDDFGTLDAKEVLSRMSSQRCASALLTTGQIIKLQSRGMALQLYVPDTVMTDRVWLGGLTSAATPAAAALLADLTSAEAQQLLREQGLYGIRVESRLYASGVSMQMEEAAQRSLTAVHAFHSREEVAAAAWQVFHGQCSLNDALAPLL